MMTTDAGRWLAANHPGQPGSNSGSPSFNGFPGDNTGRDDNPVTVGAEGSTTTNGGQQPRVGCSK
jgi:hypothetical protein